MRARLRVAALAATLLAALALWGLVAAATWPGFRARRVAVEGARVVPAAAIRTAARIAPTENVWLLNPWALRARVEAIPYVATATLARRYPNDVRLIVTERRPESCLRAARGALVTLDASLRVLQEGCRAATVYEAPRATAPRPGATARDATLDRLLAVEAALAAQRQAIARLSVDRDGGAVALRTDGVRLLLGDDDRLEEKTRLIAPILAAARRRAGGAAPGGATSGGAAGSGAGAGGVEVAQIDLRAADTPVVRYRETPHATQNRAAQR